MNTLQRDQRLSTQERIYRIGTISSICHSFHHQGLPSATVSTSKNLRDIGGVTRSCNVALGRRIHLKRFDYVSTRANKSCRNYQHLERQISLTSRNFFHGQPVFFMSDWLCTFGGCEEAFKLIDRRGLPQMTLFPHIPGLLGPDKRFQAEST